MPNLQHDDELKPKRATSGCIVAFLLVVALLVSLGLFARHSRIRTRVEFARQQEQQRLQTLADVKAGRSDVSISDPELLTMLANDPECVEGVTYIFFYMTDLADSRFRRVAELNNVVHVAFYECQNADNLLLVAKDMDSVQSLSFEATLISDQALRSLGEFPDLRKVHFKQVVADETIDWLNELLPNTTVETPYPAAKEPPF